MVFSDYAEKIMATGPKDPTAYLQMNKILAKTLADGIVEYIKSKENGASISTKNIKLSVVEVKSPNAESSAMYSGINYRRLKNYIEFYNTQLNKAVRIVISTTGERSFLIGYYNNYKKTASNNHFSKETIAVNEFYAPIALLNTTDLIGQTANFLMGSESSPFVNKEPNAIQTELH